MNLSALFIASLGALIGAGAAWLAKNEPKAAAAPQKLVATAAAAGSETRATRPGDALAAWKHLYEKPGGFSQRMSMLFLILQASPAELPGLLEVTKGNVAARRMILRRWVETDIQAASAWLSIGLKNMENTNDLIGPTGADVTELLAAWAVRDPKAAMAKIAAEAKTGAAYLKYAVVNAALNEDMETGVKLRAELGNDTGSYYYPDTGWVAKDPAKAAKLLSELPDSDFRNSSLLATMGELGKKDLNAAIALLTKFPGLSSRMGYYSGMGDNRGELFSKWAKTDINGMMNFLNDNAKGTTRSAMKEAIAKVIGEGDPKVAFDWAAKNLSGERRNSVVSELLKKLSKDNPDQAVSYLMSLPGGTAQQNALNAYARHNAAKPPAEAVAHAKTIPEGEVRSKVLGQSYQTWFAKDPAAAAADMASQPAGSLPADTWKRLGQTQPDLDKGLAQLTHIPPAHGTEYVEELFRTKAQYYEADFPGIAKQLAKLTDTSHRASAIGAVVSNWAWRDPEAVVAWGATLPTAEERGQALKTLEGIKNWGEADREKLLAPLRAK